ncbi:DUF1593 domain-containing protein [bacterium]|nr:DUF1593 domain-containing protein [bacterium]
MTKTTLLFGSLLVIVTVGCQTGVDPLTSAKPRTIVTTDGEVDDMDSYIRFLLYTNEFDVEGLVYSSSQWHYAGDGKGTLFTSEMPGTARRYGERRDLRWAGTDWMQELIGKYGEVYDNLVKHDPDFPTPETLLSIVRVGNIEFEGEMQRDTEGSDLIKAVLLDDDPAPVYLQIWGGTNTVARALKSIEEKYEETAQWEEIYHKVSDKAVIYTILDQDATYQNYVAPNWPRIKVLYNSSQFWSFAYSWSRVVPDELKPYLGGEWFAENIKFNHGPLLESYYCWGDGQKIEGDPEHSQGDLENAIQRGRTQYDFISEGDSPAYFYLLDVGLRSMENPSYGGWGGRLVRSETNPYRWEDGGDVTDYNPHTERDEAAYPQTRWVDVLQNDFAARADWCVMGSGEANHPPVVSLNHPDNLNVEAGVDVELSGMADDPDGDTVSYRWWQYGEADTYPGIVDVVDADSREASFRVPEDAAAGETIHVILEVTDSGTPPLTRYQRVIITVGE